MSIKDYKTPTDQQAEIAVLSGMLNNEQCLDDALSSIDEDYFYYDETKKAFKVIVSLSTDTQPNVHSVLKRMETQREKTLIRRAEYVLRWGRIVQSRLKRPHRHIFETRAVLYSYENSCDDTGC